MKVLFIGSHCDDLELGCGATIHKHRNDWDIHCSVICTEGRNSDGILVSIQHLAEKALSSLGVKNFYFDRFPPDHFAESRQLLWERLQFLKEKVKPDVVITQASDEHQDHETLHKESVRVFRQNTLLAYHVYPSQRCFNHDTFEIVEEENVKAKLRCAEVYGSFYASKHYFKEENIVAKLRTNGIYPNCEFAEIYQTITRIGVS
tara:strand:+ start:548 stop:1159 length:612 start_codon:yes stop_codon:yes gene_type:complete